MCDQGPGMLVNGQVVTRLDEQRIELIADFVLQHVPLTDWPDEFFQVDEQIRRSDLMLDNRIVRGEALRTLVRDGIEATLDTINEAGLRGRGGAGFRTALKWSICRETQANERYVVCNADEGEPGTFKDRLLLQSWADELLEGMTLCGGITGAQKGLIYLRGEYRFLLAGLNDTIAARRSAGLLGKSILGKDGFDFDVEIHLGAGAYICGEESSLIESLEGKRGIPRRRPPFPVAKGYLGKPTVVNNVETFIAAAQIAIHGSDWFRSRGTQESSGTKLLSISGDCPRPGIYEFPFGTRISEILSECGADNVQAVQVAGAAGHMIPSGQFDKTIAYEDIATAGSFMVFNRERDMLAVARNFSQFFVHESCGFCTPCRVGGKLLDDLVYKLLRGRASRYDLEEIRSIAALMRNTSHCGLGSTAPNAIIDLLDHFPSSYTNHLDERFGPAFDIDAALEDAREISGRRDNGIIGEELT
jgi:[NiFe] hydrogenase diaphorase moiety large subunit